MDGPVTATAPRRSLAALVGRGAAWTTLDVAVSRFGQFLQGVIVARILAPDVFGVFAVALVVHAIVVNVSELGVSAALIRDEHDVAHRSAPTVATIALGSSAVLGVVMALFAAPLASLLGSPNATTSIAVMALALPLAGLSAVPSAIARRDFRMDRIFVANAANTAVTAVVVILLALAGWGPLALAWSWVAGQLLTTALLLTYKPGRYWPGWNASQARRLLAFGLPLAGANVLAFLVLNVDYIVIGRALGATALGLYVLAFNISGWPMNVFGTIVRSVSLPGFSHLRRDGAAMPEQFAIALRSVAGLVVPICLVLGALAQPLVVMVYGPTWTAAADALVGLSVLGAARILLELCADFLVTLGRTRTVFLLQFPWLIGLTVALLVAVNTHGIAGAGAAQALVAAGVVLPLSVLALARAGVRPALVVRALIAPVVWATVAAVVARLVADRFDTPFVATLLGGCAGMVVAIVPNLNLVRQGGRAARKAWRDRSTQDAPAVDDPDTLDVLVAPEVGAGIVVGDGG
jgi:PST family polysaccharide transporter